MSKRELHFSLRGWKEYGYWQQNDKKLLKKLNRLLEECTRTPFNGIGKPEPLKEELQGAWSRRINDEHRLIYLVSDRQVTILSCRYHYSK